MSEKQVGHEYVRAQLGHSTFACKWCAGTPAENAALNPNHCEARAQRDAAIKPAVVDRTRPLTVRELIVILQALPQDIPVTGYNGQEATDFVTFDGVSLKRADRSTPLYDPVTKQGPYRGQYVDIMGF